MVGIDVQQRDGEPAPPQTGHRIAMAARPLGAILRPLGNTIVLNPPLSITLQEVDQLGDITVNAIQNVLVNSK